MKRILSLLLAAALLTCSLPALADGFVSGTGNQSGTTGTTTSYHPTFAFWMVYGVAGDNAVWPVYSAPSEYAWRGAGGNAKMAASSPFYVAGWDGDWLLVAYTVTKGGWRVGYVARKQVAYRVGATEIGMQFAHEQQQVSGTIQVSDDPTFNNIAASASGTFTVTYLCDLMINGVTYSYYQTEMDGQTFRGFIRIF